MLFHNEKQHTSRSIGDNYIPADQELHQELHQSLGWVLVKNNKILVFISQSPGQISVWKLKKKTNQQKSAITTINKIDSFPILFSIFDELYFSFFFELHLEIERLLIDKHAMDSWDHMHKSSKEN